MIYGIGLFARSGELWGKIVVLALLLSGLIAFILSPLIFLVNLALGNYLAALASLVVICFFGGVYWKSKQDNSELRQSIYEKSR